MINVCLLLIILQIDNAIKLLVNKTQAQLFVYATLGECLPFFAGRMLSRVFNKGESFNDYGFCHFKGR